MKRVGLVFLGFVTIIIIYVLLILVWGKPSSGNEGGHGPDSAGLFIAMPIIFLMGSVVTGYFSYYEFESKWGLIWMAPILYSNLLFMCVAGISFLMDAFIGVNEPRNTDFLSDILIYFLLGLYWYLASLAGVILGYLLRERFARWWYAD